MARAGVWSGGGWGSRPLQVVWVAFLFCGGGGGSKAIMSCRIIRDAQRTGLRFGLRSREFMAPYKSEG